MAESTFKPRSGFHGLLTPVTVLDAGVVVRELNGFGIATIFAYRNRRVALREAINRLYGIALPDQAQIAGAGDVRFLATGPEAWLAIHKTQSNQFAKNLLREIGDLAAISDQSDGYAVLGLRGPKIRSALSKGLTIDLHTTAFGPGAAAVTTAAHMGVILWRPVPADSSESDFELALYRSYAESFWHWLVESTAEYGLAASPR